MTGESEVKWEIVLFYVFCAYVLYVIFLLNIFCIMIGSKKNIQIFHCQLNNFCGKVVLTYIFIACVKNASILITEICRRAMRERRNNNDSSFHI